MVEDVTMPISDGRHDVIAQINRMNTGFFNACRHFVAILSPFVAERFRGFLNNDNKKGSYPIHWMAALNFSHQRAELLSSVFLHRFGAVHVDAFGYIVIFVS